MTVLVEFEVIGHPYPQGSKKAFVANGRAIVKEASGGNHAAWRNAIAQVAREIAPPGGPYDGALGLSVEFRFPMPASRSKAVRNSGRAWKTTAPDTSKLIRCLEDGLQAGGLIVDDARFCAVEATKVETIGWTGATITITREDGQP